MLLASPVASKSKSGQLTFAEGVANTARVLAPDENSTNRILFLAPTADMSSINPLAARKNQKVVYFSAVASINASHNG